MLERVLETNPEIVKTAVLRAEAVESAREEAEAKRAAATLIQQVQAGATVMPSVGSQAAKFMIVQVIDYRCPFCQLMHPETVKVMHDRPDVRVSFLLTSILGQDSETLARFALAADEQGKFKAVHNALFTSRTAVVASDASLAALAKRTGVDWMQARAAMRSAAIDARLQSMRNSWERLKQPGTPLTIIGEDVFAGLTKSDELVRSLSRQTASGAGSR
jgi:protein-disulfide isomerase